jgi:glycosyltransferase involved in cell wall biosynthesis
MAVGLFRGGVLTCYATGIPVSPIQIPTVLRPLVARLSRYEYIDHRDLPQTKVKLNMLAPVLNRSVSWILSPRMHAYVRWVAEIIFDRWAAQLVKGVAPDVVIAYENTALHTFKAARAIGAKCVLDAASLHHIEQDRHYQSKQASWLKAKIDFHKDQEIDLADVIITASELAAKSYRKHVPHKTIVPIPLGVDTAQFFPGNLGRWEDAAGPFIFAFVGSAIEIKGFDTVLSAIDVLNESNLNFEFWVAGHMDKIVSRGPRFKPLGMLSHKDLSHLLRLAHCLVMPSRFDSFGLVVLEALASGIPVIISEMVGAKQVVVDGENGFVIAVGDVAALSSRMLLLAQDRARAARMGAAARRTAERHDWSIYHQQVHSMISSVV